VEYFVDYLLAKRRYKKVNPSVVKPTSSTDQPSRCKIEKEESLDLAKGHLGGNPHRGSYAKKAAGSSGGKIRKLPPSKLDGWVLTE